MHKNVQNFGTKCDPKFEMGNFPFCMHSAPDPIEFTCSHSDARYGKKP